MGMSDREKVIRIIDELIFEAQKEPIWKAENALRCAKKELLKEQKTANLYRCPNCGTWVLAENVVRCKECQYYMEQPDGHGDRCARIHWSRGDDWFCADGKGR